MPAAPGVEALRSNDPVSAATFATLFCTGLSDTIPPPSSAGSSAQYIEFEVLGSSDLEGEHVGEGFSDAVVVTLAVAVTSVVALREGLFVTDSVGDKEGEFVKVVDLESGREVVVDAEGEAVTDLVCEWLLELDTVATAVWDGVPVNDTCAEVLFERVNFMESDDVVVLDFDSSSVSDGDKVIEDVQVTVLPVAIGVRLAEIDAFRLLVIVTVLVVAADNECVRLPRRVADCDAVGCVDIDGDHERVTTIDAIEAVWELLHEPLLELDSPLLLLAVGLLVAEGSFDSENVIDEVGPSIKTKRTALFSVSATR